MFTIFHALESGGAAAGALWGTVEGYRHFGVVGAILGAIVCGYLGLLCGWLPGALSENYVKRSVQRRTSEELRQKLRGEQYYLFHLFLAVLMVRGEDIHEELDCILKLLKSDEWDKRRFGWFDLQFAYPELAAKISDYRADEPVEVCRAKVDTISDSV